MYAVAVSDTTMMTIAVKAHQQKMKQTFKRNLESWRSTEWFRLLVRL